MEQIAPKATIMDGAAMARALTRIAHEVIENNEGAGNIALVGIVRRGANIAEELADEIEAIEGIRPPVGKLDISFYRDDVTRMIAPVLHGTNIPFSVMVDRGHRELPIRADYVGKNVPSSHEEDVRVFVESLDGRDAVEIWDIEAEKQAIANKEVSA